MQQTGTAMNQSLFDRRQSERTRSLKGARIIFNNRSSSVNCLVRNQSNGGLKLSLDGPTFIPDKFTIRFDNGQERHCIVRWRKFPELGVQFIED